MSVLSEVTAALAANEPARTALLNRIARAEFLAAGGPLNQADHFVGQLEQAWVHTRDESSAERVASLIETAARNAAFVAATPPGVTVTWVTEEDDRVRDTHVPMHGQTQRVGQPFIVGGVPLFYPGQPVGPPDVWINCRCRLTAAATASGGPMTEPTFYATNTTSTASWSTTSALPPEFIKKKQDAPTDSGDGEPECPEGQHWDPDTEECVDDEEVMGRAFKGEQRKKMAKSGTAMPDGSFPIANVEDLRNAIQAIGRAKDPAAAKRHIRKRARALGAENLIPDSWTASGEPDDDSMTAWAPSTSPPGTHDAPGWLTHPRDTQRLRDYWTRGTGAAKIRWGLPGDFNRCRSQLQKYVPNPSYLAGMCANLHYVALGYFPNHGPHAGKHGSPKPGFPGAANPEEDPVTAAFIAAADLTDAELPPIEWFSDPGFTAATPLKVDGERVYGHLATWGVCHVGIEGACTEAPRSAQNYAYFRTGEVETASGAVPVGQITMDTGHAARDLGAGATVAHYDDTGTVVADVAAGEDDHGIWVNGMLRPGLTPEQRRALRAGALSGDWRRIAGNLELVAALVVNVPGFPVPRVEVAASGATQLALVAAGIVTVDPNALIAADVAALVVAKMEDRERDRRRAERARKVLGEVRRHRIGELVASVES